MAVFKYARRRRNDFHSKNRTIALKYENAKLVQKIEGIQFRSSQYSVKGDENSQIQRKGSMRVQRKNSLNFITRKKESTRILRENLIMYDKLKH